MTVDEINDKLKSLRMNPIKNGYCAWEMNGDETYGLNYSQVQKVAKDMKPDPCLADELYACQNHDMKLLATLIDDPGSYTRDELEKRTSQLYPSPFADKFCQLILANTEYAVHFINKWSHSNDQNLKSYAYNTLAELAKRKTNLSADFFSSYADHILSEIDDEAACVKEAMTRAAEAISNRDGRLRLKDIRTTGEKARITLLKQNVRNKQTHQLSVSN